MVLHVVKKDWSGEIAKTSNNSAVTVALAPASFPPTESTNKDEYVRYSFFGIATVH
jgi:hypothetical protein